MPNAMHSIDSNPSTVPAFLIKLWKLVEDPTCDYLIAWNASGLSFIIKDQATFAKDLLPQYFKHSNMASFIRQLNMYGFKKIMNIEKSGLKNDNNEMEFHHECFRKERSELLELIKRKISNPRIAETPVVKTNAKDILVDLTSIREKQESMDSMLLKMKSENELLWRELTTMRQKHKAQEQIIQKVIQFLVSIVQRNNPNIGVQRKLNRMLHSSPSSKGNSSQVSRTIDVLRKKNSDFIVPDQMVSPLGPVIHEVLDGDHEESSASTSQSINVPSPSVNSPDSVKESNENASPKYHLVSLLNNPSEPFSILEALTPNAPAASTENESILGIPLEYISVPEDNEVANVISIPDTDSAISIPEDVALNNVICIPEGRSKNYNQMFENILTSDTTNQGESGKTNVSTNILNTNDKLVGVEALSPGFLSDVSFDDLQQSTFQDAIEYSGDYQDDLSESLQTPKVHSSDEDPYISIKKDSKQNSMVVKKNQVNSNSTHNEHNYQLATTESSSLTKNVLSRHVDAVEDTLNNTKDQLVSCPLNFDVQKLLGLFTDDLNYDAFSNQLPDEANIKTEPSDIIGNEIVSFSPNMLGLDINNSPLFEALAENAEAPNEDFNYQPTSLLDEVLKERVDSEAADFLPDEDQLHLSPNKRSKPAKISKGKRRKVK